MTERPFHHGSLRQAMLDDAAHVLRTDGIDGLSLRELARRAGVSHAAPRRHFPDRQALLDALAEEGFHRLTSAVRDAQGAPARSYEQRFRAVATAYVDFALDDGALLELMFATKNAAPSPAVQQAAGQFFDVIAEVFREGSAAGKSLLPDPFRLQLVIVATLQGIAFLVSSGRVPREHVDQLVADATTVLTGVRTRPVRRG